MKLHLFGVSSFRLGLVCAVTLFSACAAPPKTLYQWGDYQPALYAYLKGSGTDLGAQIAALEAQALRTASEGGVPPPGLHGHLALLYTKAGDDAKAISHLQTERRLFPESAVYIDHLMKNAARPATNP